MAREVSMRSHEDRRTDAGADSTAVADPDVGDRHRDTPDDDGIQEDDREAPGGGRLDQSEDHDDHVEEIEDGAGCTEIWEHLSERRADDDD